MNETIRIAPWQAGRAKGGDLEGLLKQARRRLASEGANLGVGIGSAATSAPKEQGTGSGTHDCPILCRATPRLH